MFFEAKIDSNQYVHIIPGRLRKKYANSTKESEKKSFKKLKKEKKLIYAFFLDIA